MRILSTILLFLSILSSCAESQRQQEPQSIDLSGQGLKSIPDSVFQNKEVTYLNLGSSNPTFYPPLSALVDSQANSISQLPEDIGKLTKLKTLILNSNKLTKLPDAITNLRNLEVLDLSINKELDIVNEIGKLSQLKSLKVLKIVDVKPETSDVLTVKSAFPSHTTVIITIPEYLKASQ